LLFGPLLFRFGQIAGIVQFLLAGGFALGLFALAQGDTGLDKFAL
jgi:hypothetical protein